MSAKAGDPLPEAEPRSSLGLRPSREFAWAGAFNARDLGGIPVTGGRVRWNVLFRSGKPEAWELEGFANAASDGVRRIFDLRDPSEPGGIPVGAASAGIDYRFAPIEDPKNSDFRTRFSPYMNHPSGYPDYLDLFGDRVARSVEAVLAHGPGTLICCSAGRDRTGLVSSIILLSLGAEVTELVHQDELAVRAINERHRGRHHPYESWQPAQVVDEMVASRGEALARFANEFDARAFLTSNDVRTDTLDAGAEWLVER